MQEVLSSLNWPEWLKRSDRRIFFLKTCLGSFRMTEAGHLVSSSPRFMTWGIMSNGLCLTANILESLNQDGGCSLSDILIPDAPEKYFLSLEQELLDGTISLAVHSMKDMPAEQPSGLVFAHAWKREDPRDVLILREAVSLEELPQHAVIGTGSRRRAFQLLQLRKDLRITGIRGNVDTRIKKMQEEQLDGIVLAAAGLHRLGRTSLITQYFEPEQMIPAAAQGTLALELREAFSPSQPPTTASAEKTHCR